jgi:hypothetical protein
MHYKIVPPGGDGAGEAWSGGRVLNHEEDDFPSGCRMRADHAGGADGWACVFCGRRTADSPEATDPTAGLLPRLCWIAHARRRDLARFDGSRDRASMMFQSCFLAVETKERISAKSIAPCNDRKPPEIFCRSFIMRPSRSA